MEDKIEKYLMLMLSMKSKGKEVDFNHLKEKSLRDLKAKEADSRNILKLVI